MTPRLGLEKGFDLSGILGHFPKAYIIPVKIRTPGHGTGHQSKIFHFAAAVLNANESGFPVRFAVISRHDPVKIIKELPGKNLFEFCRKHDHKIIASDMTDKTFSVPSDGITDGHQQSRRLKDHIVTFLETIPVIESFEMINIDVKNGKLFAVLDLFVHDLFDRMISRQMCQRICLNALHGFRDVEIHAQLEHQRIKGFDEKIIKAFLMAHHQLHELPLFGQHDHGNGHEMRFGTYGLNQHLAIHGLHVR